MILITAKAIWFAIREWPGNYLCGIGWTDTCEKSPENIPPGFYFNFFLKISL